MSSKLNKIKMSSYYNKKYTIDNNLRLKNKKESDKINSINNVYNKNRNIIKYKHKNNSCSIISEYIKPNIENKSEKKKGKDEDKLIIKTSLLKSNKDNVGKGNMNEQDKYHINFELLSNAGINNDISINLTFI